MAIKRIQLRGISHSPSDNTNTDGGCSESFNVHLVDNEIAPVLPPIYASELIGLPAGSYNVVYIHKTENYSNPIYYTRDDNGVYVYAYVGGVNKHVCDLTSEIIKVSSLGNTLMILTSEGLTYSLFKNGAYVSLGSSIPLPTIGVNYTLRTENGSTVGTRADIVYKPTESDSTDTSGGGTDSGETGGDSGETNTGTTYTETKAVPLQDLEFTMDASIAEGDNVSVSYNLSTDDFRIFAVFDSSSNVIVQSVIGTDVAQTGTLTFVASSAMTSLKMHIQRQTTYSGEASLAISVVVGGASAATRSGSTTSSHIPGSSTTTGITRPSAIPDYHLRTIDTVKERIPISEIEGHSPIYEFDHLFGKDYMGSDLQGDDSIKTLINEVKDVINYGQVEYRKKGFLTKPVIIRYALRLYDGTTYYRHSFPILVDPNGFTVESPLPSMLLQRDTRVRVSETYLRYGLYNEGTSNYALRPYTLSFSPSGESNLDNWKDIVTSVDIFASEPLDLVSWELDSITKVSDNESTFKLKTMTSGDVAENIIKASQFYLIKSIPINDYVVNGGAAITIDNYSSTFGDSLYVGRTLTDDNGSNTDLIPGNVSVFNSRAMLSDVDVKYLVPNTLPSKYTSGTTTLKFHLNTEDGTNVVVEKSYAGVIGPWIFFPDRRCYQVDVYFTIGDTTGKKIITMTEDSYLNGAYFFGGMKAAHDWYNGSATIPEGTSDTASRKNTLYQSEIRNPFVFPYRYSFTGKILDTAVITKPLSTGQFGYADIYAFTDEGIWAMPINADGTIGSTKPVSQDVAIKGTICQLDQAISFTTTKGVMLLTGSDLKLISESMAGRDFKLDEETAAYLSGEDERQPNGTWATVIEDSSDNTTFASFVQEAFAVYDYTGQRIIYFNSDKNYAYAYELSSMTWHKFSFGEYNIVRSLNSYPKAMVVGLATGNNYSVLDFTSVYDDTIREMEEGEVVVEEEEEEEEEEEVRQVIKLRVPGVIITRALSLDADNVRKVIRSLRIRGDYEKGDVRYVLLGSNDGRSYRLVTSLGGCSFKWFRVVVLTAFSALERLSYIEIEYETRFENRLR